MAHIELNVTRPDACTGELGAYFANAYFLSDGRQTRYKLVSLGHERPDVSQPVRILDQVRKRLGTSISPHLPLSNIAAVSITRACLKQRHPHESRAGAISITAERLASFVLARSLDDIEAIEPIQPPEQPNAHGFGMARRKLAGARPIRPLIHLPVTPDEIREIPITSAVRALQGRGMSDDPYVALHSSIEQILTPADLR